MPKSKAKTTPAEPVQIYAFDFDGTISTRDTFALFIRYYAGTPKWLWNITTLLPSFIRYGLGLIHRDEVKKHVCAKFFSGQPKAKLTAKSEQFAYEIIPPLIRPQATECLREKLLAGQRVMIVSASLEDYLIPWANALGIDEVYATQLDVKNGTLTGELLGSNCWGDGKTARIAAEMGQTKYEIAEAYGDSQGDKPMLVAAKASFWRPFRL